MILTTSKELVLRQTVSPVDVRNPKSIHSQIMGNSIIIGLNIKTRIGVNNVISSLSNKKFV